jgi:hypothetical protein
MQVLSNANVFSDADTPSPEEVEAQLSRILQSRTLGHSTVLQSFLRFVTEQKINGRASDVSEYTIATKALGRGPDFDSAADTIVRTQAYRLRQKLAEYYGSEGRSDAILIEIPKGHYIPSFRARHFAEDPVLDEGLNLLLPTTACAPRGSRHPRSPKRLALPLRAALPVLFLSLIAFGLLFGLELSSRSHASKTPPISNPVDAFWRGFLQNDREPIIAYTNALCLATESGDFISYRGGEVGDRGTIVDPAIASRVMKRHEIHSLGNMYFEDSVTGVGDVLAATAISNAIIRTGGQPSLKRGRLLTTYDLETHNVVFIGSPFVNELLNEIPGHRKFVFMREPRIWESHIDDIAPQKDQPVSYSSERAHDTRVILSDYAVVTCLPGLKQNRKILILAGLTTSGTAAAAQFATSPDGIAEMARRLQRASQKDSQPWPSYFEFLIRAQLSHGLDVVQAECVASHVQ